MEQCVKVTDNDSECSSVLVVVVVVVVVTVVVYRGFHAAAT